MKKLLVIVAVLVGLGLLLTYPPAPVLSALFDLERKRHGLEYKTTEVDGETWHYLEGGAENPETIVLIHGFSADKDNWMRFSKHLVDQYRVIAPDLPGWGESVRHDDWSYRLPEQVQRLDKFLTQLGIERFHLAGNSMGGHTTGLYGATFPNRVITLGLINAAGVPEPNPSELSLALLRGENPLLVESVEDYDRLLAFVSYEPPFVPPAAKRYFAELAVKNKAFNDRIFKQLMTDRRSGLEPLLPNIKTPTLVLWGDTDRLIDVSSATVFGAKLPNAEVVIMEQTGHVPMVEKPAESAMIYKGFIKRHGNRRDG